MILLIDNYDSFSYNLYQLIGSVYPDIRVIRNDDCTVEEIEAMQPAALILSPGPGRPEDAGICIPAIRYFAGKLPILGVCLGHQAICEAFGGTVTYAKQLMHGKQKQIRQTTENRIFASLPETFLAARYHSLAAKKETLPPELAAYVVNIPSGQDIVNNGVAVEITLIGIPIIRQIKLYFSYAYAGGKFDPRGLKQSGS